jgi:hypothetical protein
MNGKQTSVKLCLGQFLGNGTYGGPKLKREDHYKTNRYKHIFVKYCTFKVAFKFTLVLGRFILLIDINIILMTCRTAVQTRAS